MSSFIGVVTKHRLVNLSYHHRDPMNKETVFSEIIRANQDRIMRVCSHYFANEQDRQDAYQESLLRIWNNLSSFRKEAAINTWVYRIVANTCLLSIRSEKRRKKIVAPGTDWDRIQVSDNSASESQEISDQKVLFFHRFMEKISSIDRMLVSLYLEELSTKEIAEISGLSESNVRVKIHRIKELLKKNWKEQDHGT